MPPGNPPKGKNGENGITGAMEPGLVETGVATGAEGVEEEVEEELEAVVETEPDASATLGTGRVLAFSKWLEVKGAASRLHSPRRYYICIFSINKVKDNVTITYYFCCPNHLLRAIKLKVSV
jgi:hypothetical protein